MNPRLCKMLWAIWVEIHINWLAAFIECCWSSNVSCSLLTKPVFHVTVCFFFFFHCLLLFYSYSKNACRLNSLGQSYRLTHWLKNLHCYKSKSLIFKHSPLLIHTFKLMTTQHRPYFVSQSFTNAIPFPLIYSILSKLVFTAVRDIVAQKKKIETCTFSSYSSPHPSKGQIPTPGKALQNPHIPHGYWKCSNTWGLLELLISSGH